MSLEDAGVIYKNAIFFDLEHYIYKKPICIGVFGCCYYDEAEQKLIITQYMIENKKDAVDILYMAEDYFNNMLLNNKKYIVTFSGNNDFTVVNYLFNKYNIDFSINDNFIHIDLQKEYEIQTKSHTGLKALEKIFNIQRDSELISGSNLAKTFGKIVKDDTYIDRMPKEKMEKILLYNEQDIVSLFQIYTNWDMVRTLSSEETQNQVDETKDLSCETT
ncbi:MAG: ribonuclease H-like domain-containing protein [Solirubrobacterales bacterium]